MCTQNYGYDVSHDRWHDLIKQLRECIDAEVDSRIKEMEVTKAIILKSDSKKKS